MSFLKPLFKESYIDDDREPALELRAPILFEGTMGLLLPHLGLWTQIAACFLIHFVLSLAFGAVTYIAIVQRRKGSSAFPYLAGYGAIIPLTLALPYEIIKYYGIVNRACTMVFCALPTFATFRCLEAMHGFVPSGADASLGNYLLYSSFTVEFLFDPQSRSAIKSSRTDRRKNLKVVAISLLLLTLLFSWLRPVGFEPFGNTKENHDVLDRNFRYVRRPHHFLGNNYVAAFLFYTIINFGNKLFEFCINCVLGLKTKDFMANPFFLSTSTSDFWARRWNRVVQGLLKRGVFKPLAQCIPRQLALALTFGLSGVLHEYVASVWFFNHDEEKCTTCHDVVYGRNIVFFAWNGFLILLECTIGHTAPFRWIKDTFPTPLVSTLVVLTSLPLSHLFTGDLLHGGYFRHFAIGFPMLVQL